MLPESPRLHADTHATRRPHPRQTAWTFAAAAWLAAGFLSLLAGCPNSPVNLPLSGAIFELKATDAVVGGQGLLRVTVGDPVAGATSVALVSSDPAVAAVPATATIPAGSRTVQVGFTGAAAGAATLTATLGGSQLSTTLLVAPSRQLFALYGPVTPGQVGATVTLDPYLNVVTPDNVAISLTSSNPAVLIVPDSVTVAPFESHEPFPAVVRGAGETTITAESGGVSRSLKVVGVDSPTLTSVTATPRLQTGALTLVTASLDAIVAADTVVGLSSTDASVLPLPGALTIPAGSFSTSVQATAAAAGTTTLKGILGDTARSAVVTVVDQPSVAQLIALDDHAQTGQVMLFTVTLDAALATQTLVGLHSSSPGTLAVPDVVPIPQGFTSASFTATAAAPGTTTITATLGGSSRTTGLTVVAEPTLISIALTERMQTGLATSLLLTTDVGPTADTPIAITTSNASVLNLPSSVVLGAGSTIFFIPVTAGAPGQAFVTATLGSSQQSAVVAVVAEPSITFISTTPGGTRYQVGVSGLVSVSLDAALAGDTTATFSSNNAAVATVAPTTLAPAGSLSAAAAYQSHAAGFVTLSGTVLGSTRGVLLEFVDTPVMSSVSFNSTPRVGHATGLNIALNCTVAADTTVTLTQTNPAALSIPATVIVPKGRSIQTVNAIGLANAATTVTATLNATTAMATTTPTP